jgi:exopolysaccharide biosynthesis predicted pyruvyltransferase EpsI
MFEELKQVLGGRKKTVVYIPNIGNAGDGFIAHATYQFFDRVGVSYKIGNLRGTYPGAVVVCPGGGALVKPYEHMINFLQRNLNAWEELIILPHTIRSYGDILKQLKSNSYIFCREKGSYDFARSHATRANVFLSDDLAFSCRFDETEKQMAIRTARDLASYFVNFRRNMRLRKRLKADSQRAVVMQPPGTLNAFRTDVEKTDISLPEGNIDISNAFGDNSMRPLVSLHTTYRMLQFLKQFRTIRTNRLHVSIMSAMLGLEVDLYDNNYGKNRDVFDHSMRIQYPNVRWHSEPPNS